MEDEPLLTLAEAAVLLKCDPATVYRFYRAGHLPTVTPLNPLLRRAPKLLFRRADVERLRAAPPPRKPRTPRH